MFENPRRLRQARNFTTNLPKILDLKSSSEQIFSENWRWVPLCVFTSWAQALARVQTINKNIIANMRQYLYLSCRSRFYSYAAHVYAFCSAVWEDQTCGERFLRTPSWFITTRAKRKPLTNTKSSLRGTFPVSSQLLGNKFQCNGSKLATFSNNALFHYL